MTSYHIGYSVKGLMFFVEPTAFILAIDEDNAKEWFYFYHDKETHCVNWIRPYGVLNNNGRYSKYFTTNGKVCTTA